MEKVEQKDRRAPGMDDFLDLVCSLGVTLRVYKTNGKWEWTSLLGGGGGVKMILLQKLTDHFENILPEDNVDKTRQLWHCK